MPLSAPLKPHKPITPLLLHKPYTQGILDPALELTKLEKKAAEAAGRIDTLRKKLSTPGYVEKTPAAVQADDADRLARSEAELAAAQQHMVDMRQMLAEQQQQQSQQ